MALHFLIVLESDITTLKKWIGGGHVFCEDSTLNERLGCGSEGSKNQN